MTKTELNVIILSIMKKKMTVVVDFNIKDSIKVQNNIHYLALYSLVPFAPVPLTAVKFANTSFFLLGFCRWLTSRLKKNEEEMISSGYFNTGRRDVVLGTTALPQVARVPFLGPSDELSE